MEKETHTWSSNHTTRLHFTEEELGSSSVKSAAEKAGKAANRADRKKARLPQKKKLRQVKMTDEKTGTIKAKLTFEETAKKQPTKLSHSSKNVQTAAMHTASGVFHQQLCQDDNVGAEAVDRGVQAAESSVRIAQSAKSSARMRAYRTASKAEKTADQANLKALYKSAAERNPELHSNLASRMQQRRAIRKQYAAAKRGGAGTINVAEVTQKAAGNTRNVGKRLQQIFSQHRKGLLIVGAAAVIAGMLMGLVSSCSIMAEGMASTVGSSTYPSSDYDMLSAESEYCSLEAGLQNRMNNYSENESYDEYVYNLDEISHDPYVLISMLTAMYGEWTVDQVGDTLQSLFEQQYTVSETVTEEIRTRTEMQTSTRWVEDPDTGEMVEEEYEEEVEVEYTYYICTVTLTNNNLSHLPVANLTTAQLELYAMYMATLGNRPDLFPNSEYVDRYGDYLDYDIPGEALSDEKFANMITEAEKYLGYPYVWGGSSPSTSFDCSGFVCWVINHCGNGWDVGRVDAETLRNMLSIIPAGEAQPGDIIFFQGTYDTVGASHVGIYVGNNMMIHCGDPISYADISSAYWQQHFYCFGRLP